MSVQLNSNKSSSASYYVFTQNTSFLISSSSKIDYLLIGGGGGGGSSHGGGGGAGGIIYKTNIDFSAGQYTINVGSGGAVNTKGGDTSITGIDLAYGGGYGGGANNGVALSSATIGSGGGGAGYVSSQLAGITTSGQGNNGGISNLNPGGGGGGGGAGNSGFPNIQKNGGKGGDGSNLYSTFISNISSVMSSNWISATSEGYIAAGGGGGSWENNYAAPGGKGGAGSGGTNNAAFINPTPAISNTGSGGGGGGSGGQAGQSGGSGIVIFFIKSKFSSSGNFNAGSYKLKANNIIQTGSINYNNLSLTGSLNINPKIINNFSVDKVTKVYNGTVTLLSTDITVSTNQFIENDNVYISSTGIFTDNASVNNNKPAILTNNVAGNDAENYTLSTQTLNSTGSISILSSVTLSISGDWSNSNNWFPKVVPILDYVSNAIIPIGLTVNYDYNNLINNIPNCTIANNGSLNFIGSSDYSFNNIISGTGSLIKNGTNIVTLSGINTYSNNTTIHLGTLKIGNENALSTSNIIINSNGILDLNGNNITNNNINLNGTISNFINNVTISKPIVLNSNSTFNCSQEMTVSNIISSNGYNIILKGGANYFLNNISNTISSVSADNLSGNIEINSSTNLQILNVICNNLIIKTTGNVIINGNINANSIYIKSSNITINSGKSILSTNQVILNASGNFINNNISSSVISTLNSNWVIYSYSPSLNNFGNLNSGNKALWNQTYNFSSIPIFNTYVFSVKGILNITTQNSTKIYGSNYDVTNRYILSGNTQEFSSYFTKNSITDCASGTLLISSLGSANSATVLNYPINASGLIVNSDFIINYYNTGILTVSKANLIISALNDTKTYGETTTSLLGITYNLNGDVIITDGTGYSITGLVTINDTINSIKLSSIGGLSISNVNSNYIITPNILSASANVSTNNYNINYNTATLNILKRNFTVSAIESLNNIYKGTPYTSSYSITNSKNNDDTNGAIIVSNMVHQTDVGVYMSNLNVSYSNNYNFPSINNTNFAIIKTNLSAFGTESYNGTNIFSNNNLSIIGVNGETFSIQSGILILANNGNVQSNQNLSNIDIAVLIGSNNLCKPTNYNSLDKSQTSVSITKSYFTISGTRPYDGSSIIKGSILLCNGKNNQTFTILGEGSPTNLLNANVNNLPSKLNSFDGLLLGPSFNGGISTNYYTLLESINNSTFNITKTDLILTGNKIYDGLDKIDALNCILSGVNEERFPLQGFGIMQSKNITTDNARNLSNISNLIINNGIQPSNYNILTLLQTQITVNKANLQIIGSRVYDSTNIINANILSAKGVINETFLLSGTTTLESKNVQNNTVLTNLGSLIISEGQDTSNYNNLSIINSSISILKYNLIISGSQIYNGRTSLISSQYKAYGVNNEYFEINGNGNSSNLSSRNVGNPILLNLTGITLGSGFNGALSNNYNFTVDNSIINITHATLNLTGIKTYNNSDIILASNCILSGVNEELFSLSGYGIMQSKNVTNTPQTLSNISNFVINNGTQPNNYNTISINNTSITVNKYSINLSISYPISKIYDGYDIYNLTNLDLESLSNILIEGDIVLSVDAIFNNKNVGMNKTLSLSNVQINDNNGGNNYDVNYIITTFNKIEPKTLIITALDSSKYFIDDDINGYNGASYNGFINDENTSNIMGSLIINRSNLSNNIPGTYVNVLNPSGYGNNNSINGNYLIVYMNGSFTIIGADTLSVYVGDLSNNTSTTYGTLPIYSLNAKYIDNNNNIYEIPSENILIEEFNKVRINDEVGGTITFDIIPNDVIYSSSNNYVPNSYTLKAENVISTNSTIFNNIYLTGNLIVNRLNLESTQLGITSVNKIYDANNIISTSMITINSPNFITNDIVDVNILDGTFNNSNVALNKLVNLRLYLSDIDSSYYNLISNTLSRNIGFIEQLTNVNLTRSGSWSDTTVWNEGAIPLLSNVFNVTIPIGLMVNYDYENLINNIPICTLINNGTIHFMGSSDYSFNNVITGTGSLIKDGINIVTLYGINTYSNNTTIHSGTLKIGNENALSTSNIIINSNGILDLNGNNITNNDINLNGTISNFINNVTISKPINLDSISTFNCSQEMTVSNIISSNGYNIILKGGANYYFNNISNTISSISADNLSGNIEINSSIDLEILNITCNNLIFNTTGNVIINGNINANSIYIKSANITINSGKFISSTNQVILNASGNFINNNISSTVISTSNSNWVIFSTDPSLNTFSNLYSGNKAIWGKTYETLSTIPALSKTYVFSVVGVLNITTTNTSKIYGSLGNVSIFYTLSGNTQTASNYSNLFSNSTITDCTIGSLIVNSSGTPILANVGEYSINSTGLTALPGYELNYMNIGNLSVNRANLTITASPQNTTYGTPLTLDITKFTSRGLLNNDSITSIILKQNNNLVVPAIQSAGIYSGNTNGIVASDAIGIGLNNYLILYKTGNLTINPKDLIITANNQTISYGSSINLGTSGFTSLGLVNNESITSITLKQNDSINTSKTLAVGSYSDIINGISPSNPIGINSSNYIITYNIGTLTITTANLTYLATSYTFERDNLSTNINVSGTVIGFLNNDNLSNSTTGSLLFTTIANSSSAIGQYSITGSGLNSVNYLLSNTTSNNRALTIVQVGTPTISLINPTNGTILGNTQVTINGTNFAQGCTVTFGNISSTNVTFIGTNCIKAVSPASVQGIVHITITNKGIRSINSTTDLFSYINKPEAPTNVTAIAGNSSATISWLPPSNNGGSEITNYKIISSPETNTLYTNIYPIKFYGLMNNISYFFKVSAVNIIGTGDSSDSYEIIAYPTPIINSIIPNYSSLSGGDLITISGDYFYNVSNLQFGNLDILSYTVNSTTNITFIIPAVSEAGNINTSITATGGTIINENGFSYYNAPIIDQISPLTGSSVGSTIVTITGSNFLSTTSVMIGSYSTRIIGITDNSITITTTSYVISDNIILSLPLVVTTLGGSSTYNYYTYVLPQKLSSTILNSSTSLYIFGSNISDSLVTIDGNNATSISNVSTSEIIVTYQNTFTNGCLIKISNAGIENDFILDTSNAIQNYYGSSLSSFITE